MNIISSMKYLADLSYLPDTNAVEFKIKIGDNDFKVRIAQGSMLTKVSVLDTNGEELSYSELFTSNVNNELTFATNKAVIIAAGNYIYNLLSVLHKLEPQKVDIGVDCEVITFSFNKLKYTISKEFILTIPSVHLKINIKEAGFRIPVNVISDLIEVKK